MNKDKSSDEKQADSAPVEALVRLREAVARAVDQMDYCSRDGQDKNLCSCCFQKVRDELVGALNEAI